MSQAEVVFDNPHLIDANVRDLMGVVVIGRNEGERLRDCLQSLAKDLEMLVYVDSNSTDDSLTTARSLGAHALELDTTQGFSAARARNAGFRKLIELRPSIRYVFFIDGDCQLVDGWLAAAWKALEADPEIGVVCGRRRERFPNASIYNRLCDMEWNTPVGEAHACGGDAVFRVAAFQQAGGFNPNVVAGEEPELCVRLRGAGWKVDRLGNDMTWHDADMHHLKQWWVRAKRSGFAYAQGVQLHGLSSERHCVRPTLSIWFYAAVLPGLTIVSILNEHWGLVVLVAAFCLAQTVRAAIRRRNTQRDPWYDCIVYACHCMAAKLPQLIGQFTFVGRRLLRGKPTAIEYK